MKLLQVYRASEALNALYRNDELTAKEAYSIMKLRAALRDDASFFIQRRNEILMRYGEADKEKPGQYNFPDAAKLAAFKKAVTELADTETNLRHEPIRLRGEIKGITPETLEALDGFIIIE